MHFILCCTPAQLQISSVLVCIYSIFRIHNPISLHTANGSIVTVEVGSVEVEGGAGFTYATGENTTTLWPGWFLYYVLPSPVLLRFCIYYVLFTPTSLQHFNPSPSLYIHSLTRPSSLSPPPTYTQLFLLPPILNSSSILTSSFPDCLSSPLYNS